MATAVKTTTTELGDSRVRVDAEVAADAVEREVADAALALGRDLKLSGFRRGKVPPPVVIQRVGRDAVLDEAVRRGLAGWYEQAVTDAGVVPVGDPKVDFSGLPEKGSPLEFSIEVGVRPTAVLGDYRGLEVGRREPAVEDDEVEAGLEQARESLASLETVDRAAADGDFVVVDFVGTANGEPFEGGEARGYLLELGSGRLVEGFEQQVTGASAGDEREVRVTFPDEYHSDALAGKAAVFAVSVKEVKEKRLPELDDDLASEAGGFDTLDELRSDIRSRLEERDREGIEREYREAVVDAVAAASKVDLPKDLVHAKAHEMWSLTARRLRAQGIEPEQYVQMTGKTEHDLIDEAEPEAERALARECVLAAVVEAEEIEVSDEELLDALRAAAGGQGGAEPSERKVKKAFDRARAEGRDDVLREDIAMRKAVDLLAEGAKPIPVEQAKAREELWTPEKDAAEEPKQLWTPGS